MWQNVHALRQSDGARGWDAFDVSKKRERPSGTDLFDEKEVTDWVLAGPERGPKVSESGSANAVCDQGCPVLGR